MGCGQSSTISQKVVERVDCNGVITEEKIGVVATSESFAYEKSDTTPQFQPPPTPAPIVGKVGGLTGTAPISAASNIVKSIQVRNFIRSSLAKNEVFMTEMNLRGVEEESIQDLVSAMNIEKYPKNDVLVVNQGDADHDCMYVVSRGQFLLFEGNKLVGAMGLGSVVGDSWFFGRSPADFTIRAKRGSECYVLSMSRFLAVVGKETLYSQIDVLDGLNDEQLYRFKSSVVVEVYRKDEVIYNKGDPGLAFYIILSGLVALNISSSDYDGPRLRKDYDMILGLGSWFGEEALILGGSQYNTACAAGVVTLCKVTSEVFHNPDIFGPVRARLQKDIEMAQKAEHTRRARRNSPTVIITTKARKRSVGFGGLVDWTHPATERQTTSSSSSPRAAAAAGGAAGDSTDANHSSKRNSDNNTESVGGQEASTPPTKVHLRRSSDISIASALTGETGLNEELLGTSRGGTSRDGFSSREGTPEPRLDIPYEELAAALTDSEHNLMLNDISPELLQNRGVSWLADNSPLVDIDTEEGAAPSVLRMESELASCEDEDDEYSGRGSFRSETPHIDDDEDGTSDVSDHELLLLQTTTNSSSMNNTPNTPITPSHSGGGFDDNIVVPVPVPAPVQGETEADPLLILYMKERADTEIMIELVDEDDSLGEDMMVSIANEEHDEVRLLLHHQQQQQRQGLDGSILGEIPTSTTYDNDNTTAATTAVSSTNITPPIDVELLLIDGIKPTDVGVNSISIEHQQQQQCRSVESQEEEEELREIQILSSHAAAANSNPSYAYSLVQ